MYEIIVGRKTLLGRMLWTTRYEGDQAGAVEIINNILGFRRHKDYPIDDILSTEDRPCTFILGGPYRLRIYKTEIACTPS